MNRSLPAARTGFLLLTLIVLLSSPACPVPARGAEADARVIVPTSEWTPPVIDTEDALANAPWLLVLKVAQEEIGYVEGPGVNASKYGEWCGDRYTAWCAEFLTWCVNEADERWGTGLMDDVFPYYRHPKKGAPWFIQRERFIPMTGRVPVSGERVWMIGAGHYLAAGEYLPYPGDYMWFSYSVSQKATDHVAIVEGVSLEPDGSYLIHVIEGNNPDRVQRAVYDYTWGYIYGYGTPVRRAQKAVCLYTCSNDVLPINRYLYESGYLTSQQVTSDFLSSGVSAVKNYQRDHGLDVTGQVDRETRVCMEKDPRFLKLIGESSR